MSFVISGVEEIQNILEEVAPKHARNLMRATMHGVASEITKRAKKRVRVDSGNLKKAIKTKRKKSHPDKPTSQVYITTGKSAKNDGFYWRFIEYGTRGKTANEERPFIKPSVKEVQAQLPTILKRQFGKKLEAAIRREKKKRAKK